MEPPRKANRIAELIAAIPVDCPDGELGDQLPAIFRELACLLPGERQTLELAITLLAERRGAVRALLDAYAALPRDRFEERLVIVRVVGALRREDAFEALAAIAREVLPPKPARVACLDLPPRAREEMIQSKAVHGIAYLRTERALGETERVMREHESVTVRVEAIDAWMWNNGDSEEAARHLYGVLEPRYHPYVERPRFRRGIDSSRFDARMLAWMRRWAPGGKLPPNPHFIPAATPGKR